MNDFSVDYYTIDVKDIVNVHRYLMNKHYIKECSNLLNKLLLHY